MKKANFVPLIDKEKNKERLEILQDILKSLGIASRINKSNENGVVNYVLTVEEQYLDEALEVVKVYARGEEMQEGKSKASTGKKNTGDKTATKQKPQSNTTKKEVKQTPKKEEQTSEPIMQEENASATQQETTAKPAQKSKESNTNNANNQTDVTMGGYLVPVFNDTNSSKLAKIQVHLRKFDIHSFVVAVKENGKTRYKLVVYPYDYKEATMYGLQFCEKGNVFGLEMEGIDKPIVKGFAKNNERIIENEVKNRQAQMFGRHGDDNNVVEGGKRNEGTKIEAVSIGDILKETGNGEIVDAFDKVFGITPEESEETEQKFGEKMAGFKGLMDRAEEASGKNPPLVQAVTLKELGQIIGSVESEKKAPEPEIVPITKDPKALEEIQALLREEKAKMPKPTVRSKGNARGNEGPTLAR